MVGVRTPRDLGPAHVVLGVAVHDALRDRLDHRAVRGPLERLFDGDDDVARMRPRLHEVRYRDAVHLFQRRASCCRYYLLPAGELCASCPLVADAPRLEKNLAWMRTQLDRQGAGPGHE